MNTQTTTEKPVFEIRYEFTAPRELVFNAFGSGDAVAQWWGPVETRNSVISFDFRPGGIYHYKMEAANRTSYGRVQYRKIHPHDLLELTVAFADEKANIVRAPFDIPFPLEVLYRFEFTEQGGKTLLRMTGEPVNAGPEEIAAFRSINKDMQRGFGAMIEQLAKYLGK